MIAPAVAVGAGEQIVWTVAVAVGAGEMIVWTIACAGAVAVRECGKIVVGAVAVTTVEVFLTPSFLLPMLNWLDWRTIICPFQTMHHLNSVRRMKQWMHYCKLPIPTAVLFIVVINLGGE